MIYLKKTPIRIMDLNFDLLGEIDNYESLQLTRSWHGIGRLEMRINRYKQHVDKLQRNNIVFPYNHLNKAYIIRYRSIELDENGKITENWIIIAKQLKCWTEKRLTYPSQGKLNDNIEANAETVMLHYTGNNVTDPVNINRKRNDIVLADDLNRGPIIKWKSVHKDLADELKEISKLSGLGWNIEMDIESKNFIFKIDEGRNLTANQSVNPPAIFSTEYETLGEMTYTESEIDYYNVAIVIGPEKEKDSGDHYVVEVGNHTGANRYELLVDAKNIETEIESEDEENGEPTERPESDIIADMIERGDIALEENKQEVYVEGQALTKSRLFYEKDYDLGDLVTLQNKDWGVTLDARITEVKEIYEPGNIKTELTFDNPFPTFIDKIKKEIKNA